MKELYPDTHSAVLAMMSSLQFGLAVYKTLATITDTTSKEQRAAVATALEMLDVIEKEGHAAWQKQSL